MVEEVEGVRAGQGGAARLLGGEEAVVGGDQILEVVEVQHARPVRANQQEEQLTDLNQLPEFFWQWGKI